MPHARSSSIRSSRPLALPALAGALVSAALLVSSGCRPAADAHADSSARVSFNRDIRPIITENCYHCHGPDSGSRKADLRLDNFEYATAANKDGRRAIVPGDPDRSEAFRRIITEDTAQRMPPPEMHKHLKESDIALIRRWIEQGAPYEPHWSFIPPKRATPPTAPANTHPVDAFVRARLATVGLAPQPEADRSALLRRVSLDLTGLVPTPEELDAFLHDSAPDAYERAVDRLLASPRYGEHRAQAWLDLARYADTHGLHFDNARDLWPYRDWVIRSFNHNLPYDRFVIAQVAGDLLPDGDLDTLVASGFLRAHQTTNENGTIAEEVEFEKVRDRVETFGTAFLGLTVGCAACHDHKFDPVSQKEFFQLSAFFANQDDLPWDKNTAAPAPRLAIPRPEDEPAYRAALKSRQEADALLRDRRTALLRSLDNHVAAGRLQPTPVSSAGLVAHLRLDEGQGRTLHATDAAGARRAIELKGTPPVWAEDNLYWSSFRLASNTEAFLGDFAPTASDQPLTLSTWLVLRPFPDNTQNQPEGTLVAHLQDAATRRGWELSCEGKGDHARLRFTWAEAWPDRALSFVTEPLVRRGAWHHVTVTYDPAAAPADRVAVYLDGQRQPARLDKSHTPAVPSEPAQLSLGRRALEAEDTQPETRFQDLRLYARTLAADEVARLPLEAVVADFAAQPLASWTRFQRAAAADLLLARNPEAAPLLARRAEADAALKKLSAKPLALTLIAGERNRPAYAQVLRRGVYNDFAEEVAPATPVVLPPLPEAREPSRLDLARWLFKPDHPLTARVAVNRIWQDLFGTGLVETAEDFGVSGASPTHPELLDWLAVEFRESGWDMKHLYRLLVTSATYRQSARITPEALEKDPRNLLLSRGPRYRVPAESIRDNLLHASGLLREQIGGPSVKPAQPSGIWEPVSIQYSNTRVYVPGTGDDLHRRSLYTFWKRQAPHTFLQTFNAPTREVCVVRRERTNTPLQALALWNDPVVTESSLQLARLALASSAGDFPRALEFIYRRVLARPPRAEELAVQRELFDTVRAQFAADAQALDAFLAAAPASAAHAASPADLPRPDWAAAGLVATAVFNLDEALNK